MSEEDTVREERQQWVTIVACVLVIMLVLVLYVLSTGPVAVLVLRAESEAVAMAAYFIYWPLVQLCRASDPVAEIMIGYLQFCCKITDTDFPVF